MKVIEHIKKAEESGSTLFSCEITPPKRGGDIEDLYSFVSKIRKYKPSFMHVTSRRASVADETQPDGTIKRRVERPRPGTDMICKTIQSDYKIDAVVHTYCRGVSRAETEDFLIGLHCGRIRNVFAIQGDPRGYEKQYTYGRTENQYASDLVKQIVDLNQGIYLNGLVGSPTDFCMGVAGYPEKHPASPNRKKDIYYLKQKVDAGADYIITQMFFDNNNYFRFVDRCRKAGIEVPIIPGITAIVSKDQLEGVDGIPYIFNVDIPPKLAEPIEDSATKKQARQIGIEKAVEQAQELIDQKVPSVHFFIYMNSKSTLEVLKNLNFLPN